MGPGAALHTWPQHSRFHRHLSMGSWAMDNNCQEGFFSLVFWFIKKVICSSQNSREDGLLLLLESHLGPVSVTSAQSPTVSQPGLWHYSVNPALECEGREVRGWWLGSRLCQPVTNIRFELNAWSLPWKVLRSGDSVETEQANHLDSVFHCLWNQLSLDKLHPRVRSLILSIVSHWWFVTLGKIASSL